MDYLYDQFGRKRKLAHIRAVERLEKLKRAHGSNPWPVIEECIKVWEETAPNTWDSYLYRLESIRESRRERKFASSKADPVHGGILRYTLDIPEKVMFMLRCLYTPEELDMNRDFFMEFAKRFPRFKIAEKL